ncbi:hypothetical protein [Rhodoplanes roseus]|uniref:Class I SAM-dependent methyltransferase n=1 Tax=Rhodoplanes roseus TaxID=29409 RepID=A0A327KM67_9BRAD|nr:hypothetical protein [Rhodoplanes roseus]RAI38613.1 hypothetical protein CH341_27540 [Rhodoplanes roseus]
MGYYSRQARIIAHYVAYDRARDGIERWPTGQSRTVAAADVVGPPGRLQDRRYEAFPRLPLLWALQALDIAPARCTFVDYGAGRGRALLTAARLPFRRCIGVEFSDSLHAEACENIALYPKELLACRDLEVRHLNAAHFVLPPGDLVLFFYNPFTAEVLDEVADQIEAAARTDRRAIRIVYVNPRKTALFFGRPVFRRLPVPLSARAKLALLGAGPVEFFAVGAA